MSEENDRRDDVLRRMLKTPPDPKASGKRKKNTREPMPDNDDPEGLVEWAERNLK